MVSNIQNVANFMRDLDIVLEVYYMNNKNAFYYKHI